MKPAVVLLQLLAILTTACCLQPPEETVPPPPDHQWNNITKSNVEDHCLAKAKEVARKKGQLTFLVFGCGCDAEENETTKIYDCEVSAADGRHPVKITCEKTKRKCSVISEAGKDYYTFDELEEFLNE